MIIRTSFKCTTCSQVHTVRIGMGQEEHQSHRFQCFGCGEDMVVDMHVDYENHSHMVEPVENAELVDELPGAPIINVDANFIFPEEDMHKDGAFPRLNQIDEMAKLAEEAGSLVSGDMIPAGMIGGRPFRRPDISAEWGKLKRAWSLHRNGRDNISAKIVKEASDLYYASEPLNGLADWQWRFVLFLGQPSFELKFQSVFSMIDSLSDRPGFDDFLDYYEGELMNTRVPRYFDLMKAFFSAYHEFGQVYFHVSKGMSIPDGSHASSNDFDSTRMFYGNAFETFSSSVDILAMLNNIFMGRQFDRFHDLTLKKYMKLDKASRFGPFSLNPAFVGICEEKSNNLRNASHHGSFLFDASTQAINYRSGKGGAGPEQSMSYASYLARCTKIFLQAMVLYRIEILMCKVHGRRMPL